MRMRALSILYDEDLIRNHALVGDEGTMKKVWGANVVIIRCRGAGSWAAVVLARSYVPSSPTRLCENR